MFTNDLGLIGSSLEVNLSSTVVEEPSWETKVKVTVNFVGVPYVHEVREPISTPTFDLDSVSDTTLKIIEDKETGAQFFSPVFLVCVSDWSSTLPKIKGEDEGKNFELSVDLDAASAVVSYEPVSRRFKLIPDLQSSNTVYTIMIVLRNSKGLKSTYSLSLSYRPCQENETSTSGESSFVPRFDKNPPMPSFRDIS